MQRPAQQKPSKPKSRKIDQLMTLGSGQTNILYFYNFILIYKNFKALFRLFWPQNDRRREFEIHEADMIPPSQWAFVLKPIPHQGFDFHNKVFASYRTASAPFVIAVMTSICQATLNPFFVAGLYLIIGIVSKKFPESFIVDQYIFSYQSIPSFRFKKPLQPSSTVL